MDEDGYPDGLGSTSIVVVPLFVPSLGSCPMFEATDFPRVRDL